MNWWYLAIACEVAGIAFILVLPWMAGHMENHEAGRHHEH